MYHRAYPNQKERSMASDADKPGFTFGALAGRWALKRQILDRLRGVDQLRMTGIAVFERKSDLAFLYREEGRLRLANGAVCNTSKSYIFQEADDGFEVYFNRFPSHLFHKISLVKDGESLVGSAVHHCGCDVYKSTYRFDRLEFSILHAVQGPRKNYLSSTCFSR
ncbi:MAG: DUF6314 family protein [Candidimonas sp.]|jgi:hypothetical protein